MDVYLNNQKIIPYNNVIRTLGFFNVNQSINGHALSKLKDDGSNGYGSTETTFILEQL